MSSYSYLIRRKVLQVLGASFHIYDAQNQLIGFASQKALKLKEDFRIYDDESKRRELLVIKTRDIIDFCANYEVRDPQTGQLIGIWHQNGFSGIIRDTWTLMGPAGEPLGILKEDSLPMALVRRFACNLIPQTFYLNTGNDTAATYQQLFNPVVQKLTVTLHAPIDLNPLLILAGGILLMAIEGRQD